MHRLQAKGICCGVIDLTAIGTQPEALLTEILQWTGGQPFLTQKLCRLVVEARDKGIMPHPKSYPPVKLMAQLPLASPFLRGTGGGSQRVGQNLKFIEQLVHDRIIFNWEAQDEPEHLRTIRDRILSNSQGAARLLGIYQQILQPPQSLLTKAPVSKGEHRRLTEEGILTDDSREQMELLLSGLVVKQQGFLKVKNPIYQNVFDLEWVEGQLASLRPYSQAFDAWIASKQKLDALIQAIRADRQLQKLGGASADIERSVKEVLHQAVYGAVEYNQFNYQDTTMWLMM